MKVFIFSNFMWRYEHVNFDVQNITVGKQYVSIPYKWCIIRVITKLPNSEQSYKGKVKTHNYINRQNQSTTGKL